jgi:hypothetical protein
MISLVPCIISRNLCKTNPDVVRTSFNMTVDQCLYISCVHDSTLLWDLLNALTTSHYVLSVCERAFTEIDHDSTKNVIGMQYANPRPWHVLIAWSPDYVISHPSHLIILVLHIHMIIPMQVSYQSIEPFARNPPIYSYWVSPVIPSIITSSFYTSSLLWFYLQNHEGKPINIWENIPCPTEPSPLKIWSNFHRYLPLSSIK